MYAFCTHLSFKAKDSRTLVSGREYILAYSNTVADVMLEACKDSHNEDAHALLHVVQMV